MRVLLDANILYSAARTDGAVRELLRLTMAAGHECWVDPYVVVEARRNLAAKAPESLAGLEDLVTRCHSGPFVPLTAELDEALAVLPADDRPVLAAAINLGCKVLLTGDKSHFGPLYGQRLMAVEIHSPATFYARVLRRGT